MKALSHYLAPLKPGRGVLLWGGHLRALTAAAAVWGSGPKDVWAVGGDGTTGPGGTIAMPCYECTRYARQFPEP